MYESRISGGRRSSAQQAIPSREHEPLRPQQPVRPPRRPSVRPAIEVVYFENLAEAAATEPLPTHERGDLGELHVCPDCDRGARLPGRVGGGLRRRTGRSSLRCPNCEWNDLGVFDQATVDRFDDELDRGTEALMRDLKRLTQANMEDEIDRFVLALGADAILPEDF